MPHHERVAAWRIVDLPTVARLSLVLAVTGLGGEPSCVVAASPDLPAPERRGPFIASAVPPTFQTLDIATEDVTAGRSVPLQLDLRADDAGRQLAVVWYEDYQPLATTSTGRGGALRVAPGTFDEPRSITIDYVPTTRVDDGRCHSVTAIVTYDYDAFADRVTGPAVLSTWWFGVRASGRPAATMDTCYGAVLQAPPDAGAEAG